MSQQIIQLDLGDFDELLSLLDRSFPARITSFRDRLPNLHEPTEEKMRCHYGIREAGRLVAALGAYPLTWRVGQGTLEVVGVGAVATDPDCRGRGLMTRLMDYIAGELRRRGTALSVLGGPRQRYRRFGWEKAGVRIEFGLNRAQLQQDEPFAGLPPLQITPLDDEIAPAELAMLRQWHDRLPVHCARKAQEFAVLLRHWLNRPYVARDEEGALVGYAVLNSAGRRVTELAARDEATERAMVPALLDKTETGHLSFARPGLFRPLDRWLGTMSEWSSCAEAGNWQVFDWPRVIEALLAVRCANQPLPDGSVVLGIESEPRTLRLVVRDNQSSVSWSGDAPALTLNAAAMTRLLLGPHKPSQTAPLPPRAAVLEAWCPLPAMIPTQDEV